MSTSTVPSKVQSNAPAKAQIRLAVVGRKGGTGKTTTTLGLASILAAQKRRVLVVDLDPQSNAAYGLGLDPAAPGTVELLRGKKPEPLAASERLHVLPGNAELLERDIQDAHPDDLAQALKGVPYDVILFDCPPGNERLELMAISASNAALIIVTAHQFALAGASRIIEFLDVHQKKGRPGPAPDRVAVVMNLVDLRRVADRKWIEEVQNTWGELTCFEVRQDAQVAAATNLGMSLLEHCPDSRGVEDLKVVAKWVKQ